MRPLLLLLAILTSSAADLEQITLADGRRLVGYYDENAGTVTIEGPPKAVIRVTASQVAGRNPYIRAVESDPVKRLTAEVTKWEAEQSAAAAEVTRLRAFASTHSGREADTAVAQANAQEDLAKRLAVKIADAKERLAKEHATKEREATEVAAAQKKAAPQNAPLDAMIAARAEAKRIHGQAVDVEYKATVAWLSSLDFDAMCKMPPPLGKDPRKSEIAAHQRLERQTLNANRYHYLLQFSAKVESTEQKENLLRQIHEIEDQEKRIQEHEDRAN